MHSVPDYAEIFMMREKQSKRIDAATHVRSFSEGITPKIELPSLGFLSQFYCKHSTMSI